MSSKSVKPDKLLAVQQDVKEVKVRTNKISLDLESHKRNVRKQNLEQKRLEMKGWCVVSGSSVPAKMKGEKITPLVTMLIQNRRHSMSTSPFPKSRTPIAWDLHCNASVS